MTLSGCRESALNMFNDLQKRGGPTVAGVQLKCGWARGSRQLPADIAALVCRILSLASCRIVSSQSSILMHVNDNVNNIDSNRCHTYFISEWTTWRYC
jgi:hypothetical protein